MNKKLIASMVAATFAALGVSGTASAQWAVTNVNDIPNMITKGAWQAANIAKYVEQIEQLKMTVEQQKQQYQALTGTRGLGEIFNDPSMSRYVPDQWSDLYNGIRNGNLQGITSAVDAEMQDQNSGSLADMSADLRKRQQQSAAVNHALAMKAYDANIERMSNIQNLLGQINSTSDPKAIADLQARMAGEQAMIANEQSKLKLVAMMEAAERQSQEAKANAEWNKMMTAPNNLQTPPDSVVGAQ